MPADLGRLALGDFIPAVSRRFAAPTHLASLLAALERTEREPVRLVVSTPPRHGKTESLLHAIAWTLTRQPHRTIGYISYATELSRSKSRRARMLAEAAGVALADDANRLEEWRTTAGGGVLATGIGGPLTGFGLDLLLVDDPVKNRAEAESSVYRDRNWEWFNDVAYTRIEPGGSAIVVQTRWHPDDLAGRLIAAGWPDLRLPAIDDDGAALWPARWPLPDLAQIRAQVGDYTWSSLYQGTPRSRGGRVFGDVRFYDALPPGYRLILGVDFAYTARTYADYSVIVVLAEAGGTLYVLDVCRQQVTAPEFGATLRRWEDRWGAAAVAHVHGIEQGIVDLLIAQHGVRLSTLPATADKFVRAQPAAAAWNDGRLLLPRAAPWLDDFVAEVAGFTGVADVHDDQVDALSSAVMRLDPTLYVPAAGAAVELTDVASVYGPAQRMSAWR